MAKKAPQPWTEIEFADMLGVSTNTVNPGFKFGRRMLNVHSHEKQGALTLRPGYSAKYLTYSTPFLPATIIPVEKNAGDLGYLNFDMFVDKQADPIGKEITCLIQKATIQSIDMGSGPVVADTMNTLNFWIRPYWNGTSWIDNWKWLNETLITRVSTASDSTYLNQIQVAGNFGSGPYLGWTIYNKTKNQYAQIIDTPASLYLANQIPIVHTLFNAWDVNDVVILMKNYFPIDYLAEMFNVNSNDIVFHKVNNDLRIGFGGQENRLGVSIGYRKKSNLLGSFDFTQISPTLNDSSLSALSSYNEVMLDPFIMFPVNAYGIDLVSSATGGNLIPNVYYFRLTGKMDGYDEQLLAEGNITLLMADGDKQKITAFPYLTLGLHNKRITEFNVYASTDNIIFFFLQKFIFTADSYVKGNWEIDNNGRMYLVSDYTEIFTDANAARIVGEVNSIGNLQKIDHIGSGSLVSDSGSPPGAASTYVIYYLTSIGSRTVDNREGFNVPLAGLKPNTTYVVKAYLYCAVPLPATTGSLLSYLYFTKSSERVSPESLQIIQRPFASSSSNWQQYTIFVTTGEVTPDGLAITINDRNDLGEFGGAGTFGADNISIQELNNGEMINIPTTIELNANMGYVATYDLMKSWDQALELHGRIYYLNPFVDKRYENIILVSPIAPPNTFMWDIASFSNYRELKRTGNAIGFILLPSNDILILKDNSIESLSDDGLAGVSREPIPGFGCISRESIVNIGGVIFWADNDDLDMLNVGSGLPVRLLKNTIRDLYQAIADKTKLIAIRDKFNTYRLRVYDLTNKTEFLLNDNGIIEEAKFLFPEVYREDSVQKLNFLNAGNIYEIE